MFQAARFAPSKASGISTVPWTITVVGFLFEFPKFCVQTPKLSRLAVFLFRLHLLLRCITVCERAAGIFF
jgi:hypothetical protein